MVSRRSHLRKAEARGAREHWGLEPYQQAAAAALTGDTIDLLKTAASLGSIEIGGNAPLLTKVIDAGFLEKTLGCPNGDARRFASMGTAGKLVETRTLAPPLGPIDCRYRLGADVVQAMRPKLPSSGKMDRARGRA